MYAPLASALRPSRMLFVSRKGDSVRMDMKHLREAGVTHSARAVTSADAMAFLEKERARATQKPGYPAPNAVDIVVCDEQLESSPASVFLYELAQHPDLRGQPVLVLAASEKSARLLRLAQVCVLERPYTQEQLTAALQKAMSPMRVRLCPKLFIEAEKQGLSITSKARSAKPLGDPKPLTTSDWYEKGADCLKRQDYCEARKAFTTVLERREDHLEACLGLARICQIEGNLEGVRGFLLRAAAGCLRNEDDARAAHIAAMLPYHMRGNILVQEAALRMRSGEYRAAALGFLKAAEQKKPEQSLNNLVARACLLTDTPEQCMRELCAALAGLGHTLTAKTLHRRLLEYPQVKFDEQDERQTNTPAWLDKYPRLREVVSVASFAAWAWKQA